jgi:zinc transport system substrate-binding protein
MKKFALILFILITGLTLMSCQNDDEQPDIVATMFTHYDLAKQIVGDKMTVEMLVPLGADIHSFEASSQDMVDISQSKLFLFTSLEIDTWIKDPTTIGGDDTIVLDMSQSFEIKEHDHELSHQSIQLTSTLIEDDHDHDHEEDLHYWVDPTTVLQMIDYIYEHIIEIDPEHQSYYLANASAYKTEIENLHHEIDELLAHEPYIDSEIYFAGHNAMGPFASRYHLHIESLFSEFKPDDDLTSSEIINFSNLVKTSEVKYLFTEALIEPKAAIAIKESLKLTDDYDLVLLELHTYHNLNQEDWEARVTYKDLLERNFENIKIALNVTESND